MQKKKKKKKNTNLIGATTAAKTLQSTGFNDCSNGSPPVINLCTFLSYYLQNNNEKSIRTTVGPFNGIKHFLGVFSCS